MKNWIIQATQNSPAADGQRELMYYTGANGEYQFVAHKGQAQEFHSEQLARDAMRNYGLRRDGFVINVVPVFG